MRKHKGNIKAQKARRTQRARAFKKLWFLTNGPCKKCGSPDNLVLDHIIRLKLSRKRPRPSTLLWEWSKTRRDAELAKCQILCASCHNKKTALELRKYEHGINLYSRHGCRCLICKAASAADKRKQRKRKSCRITFQHKAGL